MDRNFEINCKRQLGVYIDNESDCGYIELYAASDILIKRDILDTILVKYMSNNDVIKAFTHQLTDAGMSLIQAMVEYLCKTLRTDGSQNMYVKITWKGREDSFSYHKDILPADLF